MTKPLSETEDFLSIFVIYFNPKDFPDRFVVREHRVLNDSSTEVAVVPHFVGDTLEKARQSIPAGLHGMPRFKEDDPVIVEAWL